MTKEYKDIHSISKEEYFKATDSLFKTTVKTLRDITKENHSVDILIIGISRGGNIPANLLDYKLTRMNYIGDNGLQAPSHILDICTKYVNICNYDPPSRFIDSDLELKSLTHFLVQWFYNQPKEDSKRRKYIIVVDDLLESGGTLKKLHNCFIRMIESVPTNIVDKQTLTIGYNCLFDKSTKKNKKNLEDYITFTNFSVQTNLYFHSTRGIDPKKWISFWYD